MPKLKSKSDTQKVKIQEHDEQQKKNETAKPQKIQ